MDLYKFVGELDAGVFKQKLDRALSDVAMSCIATGKSGKVTITLDLKQIGNTHQVTVSHKLVYSKPTANGKMAEENETKTPMHVGSGGALSMFPEHQHQIFDKNGVVR